MPKTDPRIDAYIANAAPFAKPILERLRRLVRAACPEASETIKWGIPFYESKGILCGTGAFKKHCNLVFWKWKAIGAPPPTVRENTVHFGRILSNADLPKDSVLIGYIKKAAALNASAEQSLAKKSAPKPKPNPGPAQKPKAKPELPIHPDFQNALKKNKKAAAAFAAMPPSHRREHLAWIASAKRDETRARRIDQAVAMILEGQSRNWKYKSKP